MLGYPGELPTPPAEEGESKGVRAAVANSPSEFRLLLVVVAFTVEMATFREHGHVGGGENLVSFSVRVNELIAGLVPWEEPSSDGSGFLRRAFLERNIRLVRHFGQLAGH